MSDTELLDWCERVTWSADEPGIESITTQYKQHDGWYITWTVKRTHKPPITRRTLRAALKASAGIVEGV